MRFLIITGCILFLQACGLDKALLGETQASELAAENSVKEPDKKTYGHKKRGKKYHGKHGKKHDIDIHINIENINIHHDDAESDEAAEEPADDAAPTKVPAVCDCKAFVATKTTNPGPAKFSRFIRNLKPTEDVQFIQRKRMALLMGTLVDKDDPEKLFYMHIKTTQLIANTDDYQEYAKLTGELIGLGKYKGVLIDLRTHRDSTTKIAMKGKKKAVLDSRIAYIIRKKPQDLVLVTTRAGKIGEGDLRVQLRDEMQCFWREVEKAEKDPLVAKHSGGHAMWMPGVSTKLLFNNSGRLVQFADKTARLFGMLRDHDNKKEAFRVDVKLEGFVPAWKPEPHGSPKLELKDHVYSPHGPIMPVTWRYYTQLDGMMMGLKDYLGGAIKLERTGPSFQMGKGANGKNKHLGASTWIAPTVLAQPLKEGMQLHPRGHADFNLDMTKRLGKKCALDNSDEGPVMTGNHIVNGSFEEPVLTKSWDIFSSQQTPGWMVSWNDPNACSGHHEPMLEIQESGLILPAAHGAQLAELDTDCHGPGDRVTTITLSQTIPTAPGRVYELSFAYAARPGNHGNQTLHVTADGEMLFSQENLPDTGALQYATVIFYASKHETQITFSDFGVGNTHGTLLDDVQVHDVTDHYLH